MGEGVRFCVQIGQQIMIWEKGLDFVYRQGIKLCYGRRDQILCTDRAPGYDLREGIGFYGIFMSR